MSNPLSIAYPDDWFLEFDGFDPLQERSIEALLTVSNGRVGTQASLWEGGPASTAATVAAGLFDGLGERQLVLVPNWLSITVSVEGHELCLNQGVVLDHRRRLDFRRGQVMRVWRHRDPSGRITQVREEHAVSMAERDLMLQQIQITPENYTGEIELRACIQVTDSGGVVGVEDSRIATNGVLTVTYPRVGRVLALGCTSTLAPRTADTERRTLATPGCVGQAWRWDALLGETYRLEKFSVISTDRTDPAPEEIVIRRLDEVRGSPAALHWTRHEQAWTERWQRSDVVIDGPETDQRALRFAIYHLNGAVDPDNPAVSIGARGLTGDAYRGHVFWDTEIFLMPFYCLTYPEAARALLGFRYRTLNEARLKAHRLGYRGALYAWESADTGAEVTPEQVTAFDGSVVPIWTGTLAHHISADVAYAVWKYWQTTGDDAFMRDEGVEVLIETARFWASRVVLEEDGLLHIRNVVGPDEYHEHVDDNAFTNVMAQWNLRQAAETSLWLRDRWPDAWRELSSKLSLALDEVETWPGTAQRIVRRIDARGVIEQFEGYHSLTAVDLREYASRTVPMDVLLGRERTRASNVIKQPDALMLLLLFPDEFTGDALAVNFDYYDPRTGHGSSLSPGIHAVLAARLGRHELAMEYLRQTAAIDLEDRMGNAAGGIHMAALGTLWQAAVFGFGGFQVGDGELVAQPRLPPAWSGLTIPLQWRNRRLRIAVASEPAQTEIQLESGASVDVIDAAGVSRVLGQGARVTIQTANGCWVIREGSS